jgi:hypothetical protein
MNKLKASKLFAFSSIFFIGAVVGFWVFFFFDMARRATRYPRGDMPLAELVPDAQTVRFFTMHSRDGAISVTDEQWSRVLQALGEASIEEHPLKWQVVGSFSGEGTDGKVGLDFYQAEGGLAASINLPSGERNYYQLAPRFDLVFELVRDAIRSDAKAIAGN